MDIVGKSLHAIRVVVDLADLIKMAILVITLKIMPQNVNLDLEGLIKKIEAYLKKQSSQVKVEKEPIAFGLSALNFMFVWDEAKGSTDHLESEIKKIKGIASVDMIDVRRAIG